MAVPAARFSSPPRWSRTVAQTAFACTASLLLHALALGGLAWLYRSSAVREMARLDVQIASVYLAPAALPMAAPVPPLGATESPQVADALPAPPADLPVPAGERLAPVASLPAEVPDAPAPMHADPAMDAAHAPALAGLDAPMLATAAAVAPASPSVAASLAASAQPHAAGAAAVEWRVQDWLARHRHYPRAARRSGAEGPVGVRFVLDRGGTLQGSEILESSGHAVLDRAALDLLQRAAPFPALPSDLAMDEIELVLPIEYDLTRAASG